MVELVEQLAVLVAAAVLVGLEPLQVSRLLLESQQQ
jgi:hypothetical protein